MSAQPSFPCDDFIINHFGGDRTTMGTDSGRTTPRLRTILLQRLAFLGVACATFAIGFWGMPLQASDDSGSQQHASDVFDEVGAVERLIDRFDCWSGAAPADMEGQIPGHVIVTRAGDSRPIRGGDVLVGQALEQVFDGVDHDLRVHAFCR